MEHIVNKEIIITLSLEEGKTLFEALAELPFKQVFELIGKINHRANKYFGEEITQTSECPYPFKRSELKLIIRALGETPFIKVFTLVEKIHMQIRNQAE